MSEYNHEENSIVAVREVERKPLPPLINTAGTFTHEAGTPRRNGVDWNESWPEKEGWYWYRRNGSTRIEGPIEVFEYNGQYVTGNGLAPVISYPGKWSGPLPRPTE